MNEDSHSHNRHHRRQPTSTRGVCIALVSRLAHVLLVTSTLRADEATARFYEQLRQRHLFSLVEAECLRRLDGKALSDRDRGEVVLELSRTYAAHACQTVGAEQDDLWR